MSTRKHDGREGSSLSCARERRKGKVLGTECPRKRHHRRSDTLKLQKKTNQQTNGWNTTTEKKARKTLPNDVRACAETGTSRLFAFTISRCFERQLPGVSLNPFKLPPSEKVQKISRDKRYFFCYVPTVFFRLSSMFIGIFISFGGG